MYPIIRLIKEFVVHRNAPPLSPTGMHVSQHICWPWDLDMYLELNNGRTLTLLDLGRFPLAKRAGLIKALGRNKWRLTMAGVSVRWRRRILPFERFEMRSRALGWDDKFMYLEQSMWKRNGECANQSLYRSAVVDSNGLVAPSRVIDFMGIDPQSPALPDWVTAWIAAEAVRPWPPIDNVNKT